MSSMLLCYALSECVVNLLVCLLTVLEAALIQEKTLSVNRGDNVKISCTQSSTYTIYWYQQKSGSPPKYLLYTRGGSRASGVPSRFGSSRDSSARTQYLLINGVQEEDEATYICGHYDCDSDHSATAQLGACTKTYQRHLG